jgi:FAD binding domain
MNLGWKLAATLQGWGPDALLDSYDIERRVAGRDVMNNTLAQVALFAAATPEQQELREAVSEFLERPETNRLWARRVGGFAEPVLTWGRHAGHPLTGTRASEVKLSIGVPHPLLTEGRFVLLDLTTGGVDLDKLATPYADRVDHHHCQLVDGPQGWSDVTAVLIRPDARVAWATTESNPDQCRDEAAAVLDYWFSSRS